MIECACDASVRSEKSAKSRVIPIDGEAKGLAKGLVVVEVYCENCKTILDLVYMRIGSGSTISVAAQQGAISSQVDE